MTYYRGTLADFTAWETDCRVSEEIPLDGSGKVGMVNGIPAPLDQKTMSWVGCIPNPNDANDVIWLADKYPPVETVESITYDEAVTLGFIEETNT